MKADKRTLMAVKEFFQNRESWSLDEFITETIEQTDMLRSESMRKYTLSADECNVKWGKEYICMLDDFMNSYTEAFIEGVCNVLDSFVGEDLHYDEEEEEEGIET